MNHSLVNVVGALAMMTVRRMQYRLLILIGATVTMMFISIYQYSWSLFSTGLRRVFNWDKPTVDLTFTVFAYLSTLTQPFSGYVADRVSPRLIAVIGALLTGAGLMLCSTVSSPWQLYLYYGIGSLGVGFLYGVSVAVVIKWFPEKRGLASGIVASGFGSGTALFNVLIDQAIENLGVLVVFLYIGVIMLSILLPITAFYRYPAYSTSGSEVNYAKNTVDTGDWTWREMVMTYQWWFIYASFTAMTAVHLLFGGHVKSIALENGIPDTIMYTTLTVFPIANGISRVFGGWVSDRIGRQKSMTMFYALSGVSLVLLALTARNPVAFTSFTVLTMLFAGPSLALTPAIISDFYGSRYLTVNYGLTYTAKSWGGLLSGYITALIVSVFGAYTYSLIGIGVSALIASLIVHPQVLRKPVRRSS
ncbi:MAG: OFA family MFS transporter [Desulfurococcaceae archaeon]